MNRGITGAIGRRQPFGGWKRSGFGDLDQYGMDGIAFWTKKKKITARWPDGGSDGSNAFIIPTLG